MEHRVDAPAGNSSGNENKRSLAMADQEQVKILLAGVGGWNKWRSVDPERPDLSGAYLFEADLASAYLTDADLTMET